MLALPVSAKWLCVIRAPDHTSTTSECSKYAIWNPAELSSTFILNCGANKHNIIGAQHHLSFCFFLFADSKQHF